MLTQIIFNISKKEQGNPSTNLKKIVKKYKGSAYRVISYPMKIGVWKEAIDYDAIKKANLFVIASPKENFSKL